MMAGAGGAMRATGWRATAIRFQQFGEGVAWSRSRPAIRWWRLATLKDQRKIPALPSLSPTRAREALMMAGAGGAMRATGWRATAIRFQQFGEGVRLVSLAPRTVVASGDTEGSAENSRVDHLSHPLARARR